MATANDDEAPESWEEEYRRNMREWHQQHPNATLAEMEQAVEEQLHRLRRRLLEDLPPELEARAANRQCPRCEGPCVARGDRTRTILLPGGEQLQLNRPYMVCQRCGAGGCPLDDVLDLPPGSLSPRLQETVIRLSTALPFGQAAREVTWLLGVCITEQMACRLTERAGATSVALHTAKVERLESEQPTPPTGPALQQISADGAMVPLVNGEWAEAKTLAVGTVVGRKQTDGSLVARATDISYFSRLTDHKTFSRLALEELHRRGTETAQTVVGVMDGADWLQELLDVHRPDAVRILDFPHAVEHLATAAQAIFGANTPAGRAWLDVQASTLQHGDPDVVLAALRALPTTQATDPAAAAAVRDSTLAYFTKRREQIAYATFQAKGYPIGSGMVESGNKLVVEARLKGSGMHWARPHVDPMLSLRNAWCSDRWAETWLPIAAAQRAEAEQRSRFRREARRAATTATTELRPEPGSAGAHPTFPPSEPIDAPTPATQPTKRPTVVNGRPTADHPWRHFHLGHSRSSPASYAKN